MGNPPFEDVFPIKMGIFHCYVSLPEGIRNRPFLVGFHVVAGVELEIVPKYILDPGKVRSKRLNVCAFFLQRKNGRILPLVTKQFGGLLFKWWGHNLQLQPLSHRVA